MDEVFMDTDAVENLARRLAQIADLLRRVAKILEQLMNILRTTAFIGLVGGYAVERYLAFIKPQIENLAAFMDENSAELKVAVQRYINGDKQGACRFY